MRKIEELIKEYCPNGVKYKAIKDFSKVLRGKRLTKSKLIENGKFNVYHGGLEPLGKFNEYNREPNTVMIINVGASAGTVGYSKDKFWSSDGCFCISHSNQVNNRYLYHVLKNNEYFFMSKVRVAGIPTLDNSVVENFKIPVPPLPVQEEIVRILDSFTKLTTELTTELTKRKKQYEYYRDEMLSFNGGAVERLLKRYCPNEVEYKKIKEIAEVGTGNSNGNEASEDGEYPFFIRSKTVKRKNTYEYDEEAIIIPGEGGIGEIYHYINGKYALHQRVYRIHFISSSINAKFAYYYFNAKFKNFIDKKAVSATVKSIRKPMIESFTIPVPPLPVQEEIVSVLDNFDKLNNSITNGLPAEIEARKKQYEYYRDKLFSFKKLDK